MTAEVLLADLADIDSDVNSVGITVGGEVVRDRWNQRAIVRVTDHPADVDVDTPALFVNHSLHNVWRLGNAKLGTAVGDGNGAAQSDFVIPQTQP